eukprot:TRINITY_DN111460_c0_g1_i1.p1 TRINITY_DN111460_c0_g1~~TRINITY_DN111460_c0_g1_i1.p1  ORF type:complete len:118 (-),score=28.83 TRINITY_DN111460_c0_g1_i1:57-374(-)
MGAVPAPELESDEPPNDSDNATKKEIYALFGLAALIVMLCLLCVYRQFQREDRSFANPNDQGVWGKQNVVEKVHLEPQVPQVNVVVMTGDGAKQTLEPAAAAASK